jgi:hypothetical protein
MLVSQRRRSSGLGANAAEYSGGMIKNALRPLRVVAAGAGGVPTHLLSDVDGAFHYREGGHVVDLPISVNSAPPFRAISQSEETFDGTKSPA